MELNTITHVLPLAACVYNSEQQSIASANDLFTRLTGLTVNSAIPEWFKQITEQLKKNAGNYLPVSAFHAQIFNANNTIKKTSLVHLKQISAEYPDCFIITFSIPDNNINNTEVLPEKANSNLELATKEMDEFIYTASHDLQEPLRKITTFSGRLAVVLGDSLDEEAALYLKRMNAATANMRDLINGLLEISRVSRNNDFNAGIHLPAIVDEVLRSLSEKVKEKKAHITVENLPSIKAVAVQMQQLFYQLISNAVKFSKAGVPPQIHINCKTVSEQEMHEHQLPAHKIYYKITVADNGIGFEQQYAEMIFKTFTRLNGKSEYAGSGIGLAICRKIVEKHHGILTAEGKENEGSIFIIILPENQQNYDFN